ncbi:hypothetical protein KOW79_010613 [Hemibagrus wyckioides]|uniref:Gasdermin pore forming domain-containing protein n=1 Tax=Hemibagrus wyckioides TaxID=337641 RepID=A0A9D3NMK6_9TELE|nr:hypothetical protein KOW79_010613 [Hemibagrus wyckioides]
MQVRLNESVCLQKSGDVAIEIPACTVLAYSVSELNIKSDGHYEVVVRPNGVQADDSSVTQCSDHETIELDGLWAMTPTVESSSLNVLNEELTEYSLSLLKTCSPETITGLNNLLTHLTHTSQQVPFSELPFLLRNGEVPEEVEHLFNSSNITLKIDNRELHAEIGSGSKVLPLVLCVVIHGLACLNEMCEIDVEN